MARNPETQNPAGVKHPHNGGGGGGGGGGSAPVSGGGGLAESYQESSGGHSGAAAQTVATNTTSYTPSTPTAKAPSYAAPTPQVSAYTSAGTAATTTVNLKPLMSTITDPATRALAPAAISAGVKYEVNPSLLIASAAITDYGRSGQGRGYTNLGDGSETSAKSIRQAARYLAEAGFHTNPQKAIRSLAKATGADAEQLRKTAAGYTALDDAARKIEHAPGDTNVTGVGRIKFRKPGDRPGVRAAINAATKAGQAATKAVQGQAAAERAGEQANPFGTSYEDARKMERQGNAPAPAAVLAARDAGKAATAEVKTLGRGPLQAARIAAISGRGATARVESIVGNTGPRPRKVANRLEKAVEKSAGSVPDYVPSQYRKLVADASGKYGVPAGILSALLQQESGFQAHIGSPAGAQGIAQFMPGTAASRGVDPNDPRSAIPGAASLLAENKKQFGSWELALAAYNAGPGAPGLAQGQIPPYAETQNYVKTIMANAGDTSPTKDVPQQLINRAMDVLGKARTKKILNATGSPLNGADIGKLRGPRDQIAAFKTALQTAQNIDAANLPYIYGGNHVGGKIPGPGQSSGYDCSSFVSKVLQKAGVPGFQGGALVSGSMGGADGMAPGPGAVTVFYNDGHTFMRIGGKYFGTSSSMAADGSGSTGGGGMLDTKQAQAYANSGEFQVAHVVGLEGLKGAKVSTKGLEMAPGGTTATLTDSQPVGAPGPSSLPPTPNAMLSPDQRKVVNAAAGVSMPSSSAADYARGGAGGVASAAANYARASLSQDKTGDPIYDAFRPKR